MPCPPAERRPDNDGRKRYGRLVVVRILIGIVVVLFLVLWVRAVIDVFRRGDLSVAAKAAWAIIMLLLPFVGLLVYMMLRPSDAQIAQRAPR
jgi:H+/Cl- antiporter ClcA